MAPPIGSKEYIIARLTTPGGIPDGIKIMCRVCPQGACARLGEMASWRRAGVVVELEVDLLQVLEELPFRRRRPLPPGAHQREHHGRNGSA